MGTKKNIRSADEQVQTGPATELGSREHQPVGIKETIQLHILQTHPGIGKLGVMESAKKQLKFNIRRELNHLRQEMEKILFNAALPART